MRDRLAPWAEQTPVDRADVLLVLAITGAGLERDRALARVALLRREGWEGGLAVITNEAQLDECSFLDHGADEVLSLSDPNARFRSRVQALARRARREWLDHGEQICVDPKRRVIKIGATETKTSDLDFRLFAYLLKHRRTWVSQGELLANVFKSHHSSDTSIVRVHVHTLRQRLGSESACIRGERGLGWMLDR